MIGKSWDPAACPAAWGFGDWAEEPRRRAGPQPVGCRGGSAGEKTRADLRREGVPAPIFGAPYGTTGGRRTAERHTFCGPRRRSGCREDPDPMSGGRLRELFGPDVGDHFGHGRREGPLSSRTTGMSSCPYSKYRSSPSRKSTERRIALSEVFSRPVLGVGPRDSLTIGSPARGRASRPLFVRAFLFECPVLDLQPRDTRELAGVVGDQRDPEAHGVRRDQGVQRADRRADPF